jgi:hypothetical protein
LIEESDGLAGLKDMIEEGDCLTKTDALHLEEVNVQSWLILLCDRNEDEDMLDC